MARRPIESNLYSTLIQSELNFIPRGIHSTTHIYELIKQSHRNLCDDNYLCSHHCIGGGNDPEWHHLVRGVLSILKERGIILNNIRGEWEFI